MKSKTVFTVMLFTVHSIFAQSGYEYNGAAGRYEYNTDPWGGMAQRYQEYTNAQIAVMQRMRNTQTPLLQQQSAFGGTAALKAEIDAAEALGAAKIKNGKATNRFSWVYGTNISGQQKKQAEIIKELIVQNGLDANNYADVKAFFAVTFYLVAIQSSNESKTEKKAEAKRLATGFLQNAYIQGMNDVQKTNNILYDIDLLGKISAAGPATEAAKKIAAAALTARGYASPVELQAGDNGLTSKKAAGANALQNAKTTFSRLPDNLFVAELSAGNKITTQQAALYKRYMNQFDALVKKIGGPDNDHAFGQALMFAIYYTVYKDGERLIPKQTDAVVKLFYTDLISDAGFQKNTDKQLQVFYERLAIECMAVFEMYAKAQDERRSFETKMNNPALDPAEKLSLSSTTKVYDQVNKVKELAYARLKEFFMPRNFDEYQLTGEGFIKK